jgi:tetratricopeptide (TPR) repeat protein
MPSQAGDDSRKNKGRLESKMLTSDECPALGPVLELSSRVTAAYDAGDLDQTIGLGRDLLESLSGLPEPFRSFYAAEARRHLGQALSDRGQYDAAEQQLRAGAKVALEAGPGFQAAGLHNSLAIMYRKLGQWARAADAYQEAIKAWPRELDAWSGTYWFDLARVEERQGHIEKAHDFYQEALRRPCALPTQRVIGQQSVRTSDGTVHNWLPLAIEGLARCSAAQTTGGDWLAFWGKTRGRKVGAGLLLALLALSWLAAFAKLLGVAIKLLVWGSSFTVPSQSTPAWAFLVFGAMPLVVLALHQLRGVGREGVELGQDHPTFPEITDDELSLTRGPK